jgi:hypothetical protein
MKQFMSATLIALTTLAAATPALAMPDFRAGMDRCSSINTPLNSTDRAIIFKRAASSNVIQIMTLDRGHLQTVGSLQTSQIASLKPVLRQWASAGLGITYGVVAVGTVGAGVFAYGAAVATESAAAGLQAAEGAAILGGGVAAVGAGLNAMNVMNPVAQFERANVEKCLMKQVSKLNPNGATIIVKMNDADDLKDTKGDLKDLVHDLK